MTWGNSTLRVEVCRRLACFSRVVLPVPRPPKRKELPSGMGKKRGIISVLRPKVEMSSPLC